MSAIATAAITPFQLIPLRQLRESALNPRRHYNEQALDELAASIREQGLLTPPLVRPAPDGCFEIAAGHRRFRASQRAGLTEIPVIVREMTDQQFLEVMTIENLHREDIHPLEEAEGYQRLIERYGYTPATLAERVGRSESYIAKRLALAKLVNPLKEAFLQGEIELGHALLLCRLPDKDQAHVLKEELFEDMGRFDPSTGQRTKAISICSVSALKIWIEQQIMLDLSTANWDKSDAQLLKKAGACTRCPKRTGSNLSLFDDCTKKGDHCLDRACWHQKMNLSMAAAEARYKAEGRELLKVSDNRSSDKNILSGGCFKRLMEGKKFKACAHAEKALVVEGRDRGFIVDICRTTGCSVHFPQHSGYGSVTVKRESPFVDVWKHKKAELDEKIALSVKRKLWHQVASSVPEEFFRAEMELVGRELISRAGHDGQRALCAALALAGEKGQYNSVDFYAPLNAYMQVLPEKELPGFLVGLSLVNGLVYNDTDLRAQAEHYEIDVKVIEAQIGDPLRKEFEKKHAKAKAAHLEAEKVAKKAAKSKGVKVPKPTKKAKRAALAPVQDDDGEFEGEE
jgi:ParB family chromosome partitioning protein